MIMADNDSGRKSTARSGQWGRAVRMRPGLVLAAMAVASISAAEDGRADASERLLRDVATAWRLPEARPADTVQPSPEPKLDVERKLDEIVLPLANFAGMELSRVVATLSAVSVEHDRTGLPPPGVNIVLLGGADADPPVNLALRDLSLRRILDFVTEAAGCRYEVRRDAVVVLPAGGAPACETEFFAVSRAMVLRIGRRAVPAVASTGTTDAVRAPADETAAIRAFLQQAGVDFAGVPSSTLAFDGSQLIVTQTRPNLERVRRILALYRDLRQVEIEAKFMEVQEGALEELGLQWSLASRQGVARTAVETGLPTKDAEGNPVYVSQGGVDTAAADRTLAEAFRNANSAQQISITGPGLPSAGLTLPTAAPNMPGGVQLGAAAGPLARFTGLLGEFDVGAVLRALAQRSGTELLSAPRLTVLSGNPATITVAQEMRYPQSYGEIQSQVGTGSVSGGGSAGVSITSGTPQSFTSRNVGVELRVTPTVEEDGQSISLELNPKVTEFEGFVEYGGPSIAISGGTTVTVPPGFYQPIFSVREVTTRVTLWDGATLVMGGLTREEVKKVKDRVPVLGRIPLLGRLFRSEGESTQKRNLLIFVTARLVDPRGAALH